MLKRRFLHAGLAGSAAAVALPATAQTSPIVRWRLASSFPKSLDTIYGGAEVLARRVGQITGGRFSISVHAAGELMPAFGVVDGVQGATVECAHTASYYFVGKNKAFGFDTTLPFGMNQRQQNAWMYYGGGLQLVREYLREHGIVSFPGGNTGVQMGGWFKKEIRGLADLKGLKMRIPGIGGEVMARLGVVPQQIAGGDIYPALEKGTIDAAEWVGPYDDERLGFNKVAKYYYYPGFWEGGAGLGWLVNNKAWDALPADYKAIFLAAAHEANAGMMAKYDARNAPALRRLIAGGTQVKPFPRPVMEGFFKASQDMYKEIAATNAEFKKVSDSYFGFQRESVSWMRVTENTFDDFIASMLRGA
jgi:TRAP-type mannitol/chloroaromatic compound transport system substrate-binding protein